jgi:transposase
LQDVGRVLRWLDGYSEAGIYKVLKRLGFSRKKALRFIHSPDPEYRLKWQRILAAYQEAVSKPQEVIILFQDEFTYYRQAKIRKTLQRRGGKQRKHHHTPGVNTKSRITAALNALTGQLHYLQRSKIGVQALLVFYAQLRAAYPNAKRIYLVEDNWPIHYHPDVLGAAEENKLTLLFLPTYASWLNPIEKLWRWLRQDILHNHTQCANFKQLRLEVDEFLGQFTQGSLKLLHYVGLLSKEELASMCLLIC